MVTQEEIDKIIAGTIELGKTVFATKGDFNRLNEKFDLFFNSLEGISKQLKAINDEFPILSYRIDKHDKWIIKVAPNIGVTYET